MDIKFIARLKSDYSDWKEYFETNIKDINYLCDDQKTVIGQIGNKAALIALYDVDSTKATEQVFSDSYVENSLELVDKYEIYSVNMGRVA
tara:strand:- start:863 stop:1132 length:270 start_codon:yes stop_codon:yes gene_type:complete